MKPILTIKCLYKMRNNILKYLVIAALIINAATLLFFFLTRPPHRESPRKGGGDPITSNLKLDDAQLKTFTVLREQHHASHDSLLQLIAEKRTVLYTQKPTSLDSTIQVVGHLQEQIELMTYQHFEKVRTICTPEQQVILDKMLAGAVQHVLMQDGNKKPPPRRD